MKKTFFGFLALLVVVFIFGAYAVRADERPGRKIVVFRVGVNDSVKDEIIARAGGAKLKNLDMIGAKAVWLPSKATEARLVGNPEVLRVEDDIIVEALVKPSEKNPPATQLNQIIPWGVERVGAESAWILGNRAGGVKVGIIDTGISKDHPDLVANIKGGVNTISPTKSWNDDNGHGSHVAGIVAATNNSYGVVGVASSADLYAIKVLDRRGSGYLSDIIEGLQWAVASGLQVVNMSLGTPTDAPAFHDAVIVAKNSGLVMVAAAGNSGGDVSYPGAYPEVIAVSAIDQNNIITSWSSRGPEVDLTAPGDSIYSTYKGTGYATMSGTSMAAPHVTGAVALVLNTAITGFDENNNGIWDPQEVQNRLESGAVDLGVPLYDDLYGWGLVKVPAEF